MLFARIRTSKAVSEVACDADGNLFVTTASGNPSTPAASATLSNVADTGASTTLLAANASRRMVLIFNDSTVSLMVKYGATASATSFTVLIPTQGYWEMPSPIYIGVIDGIWASDAAGSARITELA